MLDYYFVFIGFRVELEDLFLIGQSDFVHLVLGEIFQDDSVGKTLNDIEVFVDLYHVVVFVDKSLVIPRNFNFLIVVDLDYQIILLFDALNGNFLIVLSILLIVFVPLVAIIGENGLNFWCNHLQVNLSLPKKVFPWVRVVSHVLVYGRLLDVYI